MAKSQGKLAVKGGNETILLVEDEPILRELARVILGDLAYRVLEAGTGAEAIKLFEDCGGQVDLLLTDMVMPEGMTGRELAQKLRGRKPVPRRSSTLARVVECSGDVAEEGRCCRSACRSELGDGCMMNESGLRQHARTLT